MFYDKTRSVIERDDVFVIDEETYNRVVDYICECEDEMVGQAVVARHNQSGDYRLGEYIALGV